MYVPTLFREDDEQVLAAFMTAHSFALLVSTGAAATPFATHLPLLLDRERRVLLGHVAKANPQWRHFEAAPQVLAVFSGPHAYISPGWYRTAPNVPTWNYAAVHAYGRPRLLDQADTRALLARTVETYESGRPQPWRMDLPPDYERAMMKGIVAFEIAIERLEGKWKMSQNRKAEDREGAIAGLEAEATPDSLAVAALIRARNG